MVVAVKHGIDLLERTTLNVSVTVAILNNALAYCTTWMGAVPNSLGRTSTLAVCKRWAARIS
jgi:hypothetical protein